MTVAKNSPTVAEDVIMNRIYLLRDKKIMLDRDLADLYGVDTKVLKQAVRRNAERFPKDFMFEMNKKEFADWRSQNVTSNLADKKGLRYAPFCFTEQGVTMLSCILNSQRAISVNIRIIRTFTKLREMVLTHKDILLKLEQLERKATKSKDDIEIIFAALKKLINPPPIPRPRIGFKRSGEV